MPGICTQSVRDSGGACNHLTLTVNLDGVSYTFKTGSHDPSPLTSEETVDMLRKLARWWKGKGHDLATFTGRVLCGEEGNNVKQYVILAKDVTKTNIGTAYVNVPPGLNGERVDVDFTGCTQFKLVVRYNLVGTGTHNWRVVDDALLTNVLYTSPNGTNIGEKEDNSGWTALPSWATGEKALRFQAKATVATDDPIYRGCILYLK